MKKSILILAALFFAGSAFSSGLFSNNSNNQNEGTIIVANKSGDDIYFIDRATGKTLKKLPTGLQPHEVEVSGDGEIAVVSNYGDGDNPGNTLSVYNVKVAKLVRTIDLGENTRPHGMDWINGTEKMLVTTEGNQTVLLIDVSQGEILQKMDAGEKIAHMVAVSPDGKHAYVSSIGTGNVTVFNLETGKKVHRMHSGKGAEGIAVSPDGNELWVTNRGENTLSVFDTDSYKKIKTIACGDFPIRAKFSPNGKYFVVSNAQSGEIAVFDAEKKKLVEKIKLQPPVPEDKDPERYFSEFEESSVPIGLVAPDDKTVYVANTRSDVVTVFNLEKMKIEKHLEAGKEPDGINFSPLKPKM